MKIICTYAFCGWSLNPDAIEARRDGANWYFICPVCAHQSKLERDVAVTLQLGQIQGLAQSIVEAA